MSQQDPFYKNVIHSIAPASTTNVQSIPAHAQQLTMITQINEQSLQAIRTIVREEVQKAMVEMINKIRMQSGAKF